MTAQLVITLHLYPIPCMEVTVGDQTVTLSIPRAEVEFDRAFTLTGMFECEERGCTAIAVEPGICTYHLTGETL